jgi:tRNA modification GTPase
MIMMVGRLKSWRPSAIHIDKNLLSVYNGHYFKYRIKMNTRHDPGSTMKQYMTSSSIITTSDSDARHSINRRTSTTATAASSVDTIFALSSGPIVKSGVAVIRLSGPMSYYCLKRLLIKENPSLSSSSTTKSSSSFIDPMKGIKPRMAALRHLYSPKSNDVLDQALVLWFPAPRSFTGEDVVELHVHGSKAVIKGLFEAFEYIDDNRPSDDGGGGDHDTDHNGTVSSIGGDDAMSSSLSSCIRPAGPGEFTRRAFENGKMDLTEVEGLSDLLDAETSVQRRLALKQMDGHLRRQYEQWR